MVVAVRLWVVSVPAVKSCISIPTASSLVISPASIRSIIAPRSGDVPPAGASLCVELRRA